MNTIAASVDKHSVDASEKARRIEDSISSVITNVGSISAASPMSADEFSRCLSSAGYTTAPLARNSALANEFSSPAISKHKSLASSLPSLSGVMVSSTMSNLSSPSLALNIVTTTTTTSTRSSRHLQLVGDLPENVLETSCTPPSSPAKVSGGSHQAVFASLTPVNMCTSGNVNNTDNATASILDMLSPSVIDGLNHRLAASSSTNMGTAGFAVDRPATALTQLFPMVSASGATTSPTFVAVKVEPQDITFGPAVPSGSNSRVTGSAPILSPLQFPLTPGGVGCITSGSFTTLATAAGSNAGSLTADASNSEFVSLQPAAVYVHPVQQNGQVQYVRLDLPTPVSSPSAESAASNRHNKPASTVSTVELAHSIIATMFQQPTESSTGNVQHLSEYSPSLQLSAADGGHGVEDKAPLTLAPTFILTEQSDPKTNMPVAFKITTAEPRLVNANSHPQQRYVPAGITVTTAVPAGDLGSQSQEPASVASRKRATSSSTSHSRQRQQSLSLSKDAPSLSTSHMESASGEDESEDIYIDTKELCNRIAYELKAHSIPQAVFAERVLCRSQGTLSDLLRNPKPWNKLKSGRETFRRMYVWLKQPLIERLASLELWKGEKRKTSTSEDAGQEGCDETAPLGEASGAETPEEISSEDVCYSGSSALVSPRPDDPVASTSNQPQQVATTEQGSPQRHQQRVVKKPRLVFTDIQKRTLQAIFKETQRPSREMQQTIAEHLNLDLSTVQNFFMNARRRSRIEEPDGNGDSPAPFQQVRPITPPPVVGGASPIGDVGGDPINGGPTSNQLTPASATPGFGKAKPKRPTKRPAKPKQSGSVDVQSTFEPTMVSEQPSNRLSFSGTMSPSAPTILNLPTLTLRNDGEAINVADIDALMLEEESEIGEEFIEEDEPGVVVSTVIEYKESSGAETTVSQGESASAVLVALKPENL